VNPTTSPLSETVRAAIIKSLNERLAEASDLYNAAKTAHWNVRGPNFGELHTLFGKVADMLSSHADTIAERAVQLGGLAAGTTSQLAEASSLDEYPADLVAGAEHIDALVERLAAYNEGLMETMGLADDKGDVNTVTLLSDASLEVEKIGWMLGASK
jgi:starvation-inducible DNA-binding protein